MSGKFVLSFQLSYMFQVSQISSSYKEWREMNFIQAREFGEDWNIILLHIDIDSSKFDLMLSQEIDESDRCFVLRLVDAALDESHYFVIIQTVLHFFFSSLFLANTCNHCIKFLTFNQLNNYVNSTYKLTI